MLLRIGAIILLVHVLLLGKAQNQFPKVGAFWNYKVSSHNGCINGKETILVIDDTLINGINKKVVSRNFDLNALPPCKNRSGSEILGYMFERNDSLFLNSDFLFSFNLVVGDTLNTKFYPDPIEVIVDSIGFMKLGSDSLRQQFLGLYCNGNLIRNDIITEKIGPITNYLLFDYDGPCNGLAGASLNRRLDCYQSDKYYYPDSNCTPYLSYSFIQSSRQTDVLNVSSAIDGTHIKIQFEVPQSGMLLLNNISGKLISKQQVEEYQRTYTFTIENEHSGIYILGFYSDNGRFASRKIIKH